MADILSQDEIDRLLSATGAEPAVDVPDLRASEVESVEKLTKIFFASANSALATLLARPASVLEGLGQVVNIADLDTSPGFLALFPFRSGFSGELGFLLRQKDASVLADLILGGDGAEKSALEEADLDALKEALSQIAGSGAPTLSVTLGKEVGFGAPALQAVHQGDLTQALPWGYSFLAVGTIRVDGILEAPLRILLPISVAQEMAALARQDAEEEPVGATAPASASVSRPPEPPRGMELPAADMRNIDLILDIEVEVMVRLGGAEMPLKDIQRLRPGSIIDLDKDSDAPVELVVNDKTIAKGELVVVGSDHFALRITEIEPPTERIRRLGP